MKYRQTDSAAERSAQAAFAKQQEGNVADDPALDAAAADALARARGEVARTHAAGNTHIKPGQPNGAGPNVSPRPAA